MAQEELKTLKDMKRDLDMNNSTQIVFVDELKAEAVKWYHRSDADKHKFITEFFNLTKEDLKEGGNDD